MEVGNLAEAFSSRVRELQRFACLRPGQNGCQEEQQLLGLEASVRALEAHVEDIRAFILKERTTIPKVEALLEGCRLQSEDIRSFSQLAPGSLPSTVPAPPATCSAPLGNISNAAIRRGRNCSGYGSVPRLQKAFIADDERRKKDVAPRWYITSTELEGVGAYLKGRIALEKAHHVPHQINQAIDEMAQLSEANAKLLSAMRTSSQKLSTSDRKRATELLHSIAGKDGIKGRLWFVESDLKEGVVLRLDKSSKALLVLLRHLGRVQEVRTSLEGSTCIVYVLVPNNS